MVGFDKSGVISGYQVLKHTETPGLGSKWAFGLMIAINLIKRNWEKYFEWAS